MGVAPARAYGADAGANGLPMPATRPKPETWRDWLDPDEPEPIASELITRDELLERLRNEGINVSSHDLKNWQRLGVLPLGIPHREGRSTRALYPPQAVIALALVRQLQNQRHDMAEIRQILRGTFRIPPEEGQIVVNRGAGTLELKDGRVIYRIDVPAATATAEASAPDVMLGATVHAKGSAKVTFSGSANARVMVTLDPPAALQEQVTAFARLAEQAYGGHIVRAELRLIDERGLPLRFDMETPDESPE
jgi:hypothetical protein